MTETIAERPINGYILKSSDNRFFLVLETHNTYWVRRVLRKLQTLREKDLKEFFRTMEEDLNAND